VSGWLLFQYQAARWWSAGPGDRSQRTSFGGAAEELVAEEAGLVEAGGAEALADAAFGEVGVVEGVVAPVGAVVVPEVVVRVVRVDAEGCDGCVFHGVLPFGFAPGTGTKKKPPAPSGAAVFPIGRGDFCCSGHSTRTSLGFFPSKPPWDFLQFLGRHPDPPCAATGIPDVGGMVARHGAGATASCVIAGGGWAGIWIFQSGVAWVVWRIDER
jgi:hypothetical protein